MYLNITASKDTYIHNKIINNLYRTSDSNVGSASTLDLFKLYGESRLPKNESIIQSEIISIVVPAHNSSNENLDGKYFILYDQENTKYYAWFNVSGGSVDPEIENATGIQININADDLASNVAQSVVSSINSIENFEATSLGSDVTVTVTEAGVVLNASNGNITDSEFSVTILQQGNSSGQFNLDTDEDGKPETAIELSRLLVYFDISKLTDYPTLDVSDINFKATLRLFDILDGQMAPTNFNVEIFPLAQTFFEGIGKDTGFFADLDICNFVTASYSGNTVLWNKQGADAKGSAGDPNVDVFCSSSNFPVEQLYVVKNFVDGIEDFSFDVTDLIRKMATLEIPNHGFRISFSETEEKNEKSYFIKRFASRHVSNQYLRPRLSISWNDSFRDNSRNAIFDSENSLLFQNTVRDVMAYATQYEYTFDSQPNCLSLTISTGSWSETYAASRLTAYGDESNQIIGLYKSVFTTNILDGLAPRVVSNKNEIVRIKLVDAENLIGKYFTISNNEDPATTYDFWFGLEATPPPPVVNTQVKVEIVENDTPESIAEIVVSAINSVPGFNAQIFSLGVVHVTLNTPGAPTTLADVGTIDNVDFSISRYQIGSTITLQDHIVASGSIKFNTTWSGNSETDGTGDQVVLHTGILEMKVPARNALNTTAKNLIFSVLNIKKSYKNNESARLRVFARDINQGLVSSRIALKIESVILDKIYYRVRDAISGDVLIPFEELNDGTRMSTDSGGMYFNVDMTSLFPGRSYTIDVLAKFDGIESIYECENARFKVES